MAKHWDPGSCNETSGFLFSHDCFRPPVNTCNECHKPICEDHSHSDGAVFICTACAKRGRTEPRSGSRSGRDDHRADYNEPYFIGGYYFGSHYGGGTFSEPTTDPNDFTEADAASFTAESETDFESDMSAS